jgi:hypothetical protein
VDGDTACTKIVHPHNTADDISPQVVEHEDFPYRLAVVVNDGGSFWKETIGLIAVLAVVRLDEISVQVQNLLY